MFRPSDIEKVGHGMPGYDLISIFRLILPYMDEGRLNDVIALAQDRRQQVVNEQLRTLNDISGWWKPDNANNVMNKAPIAQIYALGIQHQIYNPSGSVLKINAIKALREVMPEPGTEKTMLSLKKAKELVEAYMHGVKENRFPFPQELERYGLPL